MKKIQEAESQLKPCPFCGGRFIILNESHGGYYYITCKTEGCILEGGPSYATEGIPALISNCNKRVSVSTVGEEESTLLKAAKMVVADYFREEDMEKSMKILQLAICSSGEVQQ